MTRTQVERVAKAIERQYHHERGGKWICGNKPECWKSMLPFARAAIRAIGAGDADTKRLNWLEAHRPCVNWRIPQGYAFVGVMEAPTLRKAIDAAMKENPTRRTRGKR